MPIFKDKSTASLSSLEIEIGKDNVLVIRSDNLEQRDKIFGGLVAVYRGYRISEIDLGYIASRDAEHITVKGDLLSAVEVMATYQLVSEELIRELVLYLENTSMSAPSEPAQNILSQNGNQDILPEGVVGQNIPRP